MERKFLLRGAQPPAVKMIPHDKMDKLLAKPAELCMMTVGLFMQEKEKVGASLYSLEKEAEEIKETQELQEVLDKYVDLFEAPTELPPLQRS